MVWKVSPSRLLQPRSALHRHAATGSPGPALLASRLPELPAPRQGLPPPLPQHRSPRATRSAKLASSLQRENHSSLLSPALRPPLLPFLPTSGLSPASLGRFSGIYIQTHSMCVGKIRSLVLQGLKDLEKPQAWYCSGPHDGHVSEPATAFTSAFRRALLHAWFCALRYSRLGSREVVGRWCPRTPRASDSCRGAPAQTSRQEGHSPAFTCPRGWAPGRVVTPGTATPQQVLCSGRIPKAVPGGPAQPQAQSHAAASPHTRLKEETCGSHASGKETAASRHHRWRQQGPLAPGQKSSL